MILTIHDNNLQKVAFIDNNKQGALNFYNDKWTRFLSKASSLFEFTVFKKSIQSDLVPYQTANALNDQSFVSFKYKGKTYLFHVMTIEETEQTITCTCKDLNLELTNEYTNPYKSDRPRSFREYCDVMGLLDFAALRIGINEISDLQRTLEWEGQDTKLNRILSLANKFDAEVDFEVRLNANGTIKDFVLNVYHEHDDTHQGVGKVRSDIILKKGKNIRSIKRTTDKTDLIINAIRPTARGENGQELTIGGLGKWEIRNENGEVEFFQQGEFLYAPLSMQKYSSTWTGSTGNRDKYTRKDLTVDTDSKEMLRIQAYKELMRSAYPSVSYEIDGYVDLEIGDTAKVYNSGFYPALLLEVRVSEQIISFTNPAANKTVFDNIRALKSKLSSGIQERWQELFEASKPYTIRLSTDNGTVFKNGQGQSIVSPTLLKGGKVISTDVTWRWTLGDVITTGMTYTLRANQINQKAVLIAAAYIGNTEVARHEIDVVNVDDGVNGSDGKTTYPHYAFADSSDGRAGFSLIDTGQRYQGYYSDYNQLGSQNPNDYRWADRWAKIEVGGRNILRNATFSNVTDRPETFTVGGVVYRNKEIPNWANMYNGGIANPTTSYHALYRDNFDGKGPVIEFNESDGSRNWKAINQIIRFSELKYGNYTFSADLYATGTGTKIWFGFHCFNKAGQQNFHSGQTTVNVTTVNQWHRVSGNIKLNDDIDLSKECRLYIYAFNFTSNSILYLTEPQLEHGTVATAFGEAQADIDERIETKADQTLTQEQLNALNEKAGLMQAELEAKASMDTVTKWFAEFQKFVQDNAESKLESEQNLITLSQRLLATDVNLGEMAQRWSFLDTYMKAGNEGLVIGKNDGSSSVRLSDKRISFYSAGQEVAYISDGVLQIDNGVFTRTLQIGRFREEQYHNNPDINVVRYVGG
ncbi:phage tail protein [Streptococcus suis]|nr:phage tail protein [Streptococcus suis]